MISPEDFQRLFPEAVGWVTNMELALLGIGQRLHALHRQVGQVIGISDLNRIRVAVLSEIPLPKHDELAQIAQEHGLISNTTTGMTFGHAILLKDRAYDLEAVVHELVHVLQYERFGGIKEFLEAYIPEIIYPPYYPNGPLERDAIGTARRICGTAS
jgi:hypothetical protein